jgi:2-dehydropantoate 2-reductase
MEKSMNYLTIGAGGTGGCIGAYMTEAGMNISMIARGPHLAALQKNGVRMETTFKGTYTVSPVRAFSMDQYPDKPDIIFVCVKGYSLTETIPFIKKVAHRQTVVIPLLNLYGTGERIQSLLPDLLVVDGCIYISAEIKAPGVLLQTGEVFRIVFGVRKGEEYRPALAQVAADLNACGITGGLSEDIKSDAFKKFAYVSPMAACETYYDINSGTVQKPGQPRDTFIALMEEILALARAMALQLPEGLIQTNLKILDALHPAASTSMHRDFKQKKDSEVDGLVFEVVRLGRRYGVPMPTYTRISTALGFND